MPSPPVPIGYPRRGWVLCCCLLQLTSSAGAWVNHIVPTHNAIVPNLPQSFRQRPSFTWQLVSSCATASTTDTGSEDTASAVDDDFKPSFYDTKEVNKWGKPVWKERKQLSEVQLGERLEGYVVQTYLEGATGPKVYLECGVGRYNPQRKTWKMVNAMLRLGRKGAKESVTRKRLARLRNKKNFECFVSRVLLDNGHLEVVLNEYDVPESQNDPVSVSSLKPGQELVGTVQRVVPYGVFVDVGANRPGLLHIQKVADLYGVYIDKDKGLEEAGLERGAKIKVRVDTNEKKRLFLDFTADVKEEAARERQEKEKQKKARKSSETTTSSPVGAVASAGSAAGTVTSTVATNNDSQDSKEEEDPWAAYASVYEDDNGSGDDDDYDDYDEDRDIEDSLGLGTY
ncbi:Domain protein [Seminavis robusta]|uniref:Domain protein n=1 Tax=Seminavis robusta TaxID=568900 RepID=A0A9N8EB34_9STRA|nr:Domain protein [Seminavis robusta]|eukprot:Sro695_g188780.1 Domain protein (399) ;mRNA; r:44941-46137